MLGQFQEGLGETCYVRSNRRGSLRRSLCQVKSQRVLETLVILGQIAKGLADACYVRSNRRGSRRQLLCQVHFRTLCYVRCNLQALVMLGLFVVTVVMLGQVPFWRELLCQAQDEILLFSVLICYVWLFLGQVMLGQVILDQVILYQVILGQVRLD